MFGTFRNTMKELREIRQILHDNASGAIGERRWIAFETKQAACDVEMTAYRRKLERAFRRKPNMAVQEFIKRFPIPERKRTGAG